MNDSGDRTMVDGEHEDREEVCVEESSSETQDASSDKSPDNAPTPSTSKNQETLPILPSIRELRKLVCLSFILTIFGQKFANKKWHIMNQANPFYSFYFDEVIIEFVKLGFAYTCPMSKQYYRNIRMIFIFFSQFSFQLLKMGSC